MNVSLRFTLRKVNASFLPPSQSEKTHEKSTISTLYQVPQTMFSLHNKYSLKFENLPRKRCFHFPLGHTKPSIYG